ncbi:MAG: hypothetical protein JW990_08625, partial [Thermoleophilia bacterium]|nr:hypothetical protein [Thermoleophilia bacterium]
MTGDAKSGARRHAAALQVLGSSTTGVAGEADGTMTGMGVDKQVIRGSGLIGPRDSGAPTLVDVAEGRIVRIRPLHYEMSYDKKGFNAWKMEARGKTLEPPLKACVGPLGLAYKKRV